MSGARFAVALLWHTSLAILVGLVVLTHVGRAVGHESYAIRGGSMEPSIPIGSLAITSAIDASAVAVGDIVTVRAANGVVLTHRVVEVDASERQVWLRLKGDANSTPDAVLVQASSLLGEVTVILPFAGYLVGILTVPAGQLSVLAYFLAIGLATWTLDDRGAHRRGDGHEGRAELVTG